MLDNAEYRLKFRQRGIPARVPATDRISICIEVYAQEIGAERRLAPPELFKEHLTKTCPPSQGNPNTILSAGLSSLGRSIRPRQTNNSESMHSMARVYLAEAPPRTPGPSCHQRVSAFENSIRTLITENNRVRIW